MTESSAPVLPLSDADIDPHLDRMVTAYIQDIAYEQTKKDKNPGDAQKVKIAEMQSNPTQYRGQLTTELKEAWAEFAAGDAKKQIASFHDALFGNGVANALSSSNTKAYNDTLLTAAYFASKAHPLLKQLFNYALITQWINLRPQDTSERARRRSDIIQKREKFLRTPSGVLLSETIYTLNRPLFEDTAIRATKAAFKGTGMTAPAEDDILYAALFHFYSALFRYDPNQSSLPFERFCNGGLASNLPKQLLDNSSKRRAGAHSPNSAGTHDLSTQPDPGTQEPPDILARKELMARVQERIDSLPEIQREAVLASLEPKGVKGLAKQNRVSHAAVCNAANRGFENLRKQLGIRPTSYTSPGRH